MTKTIVEASLTTTKVDEKTGRIQVQVITPGRGSSGYYSKAVCEAAAALIKPGTPMFLDHPSETDRLDRPGRSVRDIGATFVTEGKWDGNAVVAEAQLVGPYKDALITLKDTIGVSIHGSATDISPELAEDGKPGVVEGLAAIDSVDFVTRAGRGGKITAVLESAQREHNVLHPLGEATASDRMTHLRDVVRDTHGGDGQRVWVRDQDAEKKTVWFDQHATGDYSSTPKTFQQNYRVGANDVDVELVGKPAEVRPATTYVPVTRPDSKIPTTEDDLEVTMGNIQIEESEHRTLLEKAGRVDSVVTENTGLKEQLASRDRRDAAAKIIEEAKTEDGHAVRFGLLERKGLLAELPVVESGDQAGQLDVEKFTTTVKAAVKDAVEADATRRQAGGEGRITGMGGQVFEDTSTKVTESAPNIFGRDEKKGA